VWKKQNNIKFYVGATPPASPLPGDGWFNNESGTTAVYYDDGSSAQWVELGNVGPAGPTGPTGPTGATGANGTFITASTSGPTGGSSGDLWLVYS